MLLALELLLPSLAIVALPTQIQFATFTFDYLLFCFFLDHVATVASLVPKFQQLSPRQFLTPLSATEILMGLLAVGAEPPSAHNALEMPLLLHFLPLEYLLTPHSRTIKIPLIFLHEIPQPFHRNLLKFLSRQQHLQICRIDLPPTILLRTHQYHSLCIFTETNNTCIGAAAACAGLIIIFFFALVDVIPQTFLAKLVLTICQSECLFHIFTT